MDAYLGVDVSKGYADFLLLNASFEELSQTFQLDDTSKGHQTLENWLTRCISQYDLSQVYCAVESTGGLENNWFSCLFRLADTLPVQISRLNPSVIKDAARAKLNGQVTDALSARNIASYLIRYADQVKYQQPDNKYRSFRSLQNHINLLTKQKTQLINELKQLLYSCFPELQRYCKQSIPDWVLSLLIHYPTANKLAKGKKAKIARIKGISMAKVEKLIAKAKHTVASRGSYTDGFLIESTARDIQAKQKRLNELKELLANNCKGKEVELLQSIKGIGAYSAACIMIQIEDIGRFASPKELVGYFGLYPAIKESGDKQCVSRMSKKGRAAIRGTLYMCANTAVMFDPHLKSIYAKHRAKNKSHKQALGVIMHKMLRIIWGVLSSGKAYDHKTDATNQEKNNPKERNSQDKELKTKRRMQEFDGEAPVSRMEAKKRKAHQKSQASNAEQIRDLNDVPAKQT